MRPRGEMLDPIPGLLEELVDGATVGVAVLRGEGLVVDYANARVREIAADAELLGRPLTDVFPGLGSHAVAQLLEVLHGKGSRVLRSLELHGAPAAAPASGSGAFSISCRRLPWDGEGRLALELVETTAELRPPAGGGGPREDDLARRLRIARALAEVVPQIVWTADRRGHITWVNARWTRYTGAPARDALGDGWAAWLHPDDRTGVLQAWRGAVAAVAPLEASYRVRRSDGAHRWHLVRAVPVRDREGRVEWIGTTTDIELQKQAELERAAAVAELSAVLDAIADALVVHGPDGRIVRVNAAAARLLGWSEEEARHPDAVRAPPPEVTDEEGRAIDPGDMPAARALRGEVVRGFGLRWTAPGERAPRWLSASAAPIVRDDATRAGVVETFADVTRLRELREQREDLLRMISHDLRTPLSVVMMQAQLLGRWPEREVPRRAASIRDAGERIARMIDELVEAVRLESGHAPLEPGQVELPAFAEAVRRRLEGVVEVARIRVRAAPGLPPALADPAALERVLVNLFTNALKYSPPAAPVDVELAEAEGTLAVTVRDRGPGIPPDEQVRIFERFYRARAAVRKEGIGLGLYITRLLVERMGGTIHLESAPGAGSAFTVTLPAAQAGPDAALRAP